MQIEIWSMVIGSVIGFVVGFLVKWIIDLRKRINELEGNGHV